ncbi:hypothetical protein EBU24_03235 [bacterium]|nr:hypothetical protein [bacterium]
MEKINLCVLSNAQIEILNSAVNVLEIPDLVLKNENLLFYYFEKGYIECEDTKTWNAIIEEIYFKIKEKLNNEKN